MSCPSVPAGGANPSINSMEGINIMDQIKELVTGGVDTHRDVHVAAVLDQLGRILATRAFPTTRAGYSQLLSW